MIIFRDRRALFVPFYKPTGISVEFDYNTLYYRNFDVNLPSCMTLELEHFHSTVNCKQGFQTMQQYARSFSASGKECIKFLTQ